MPAEIQSVASFEIRDHRGFEEPISDEALAEQQVFENVTGVEPQLVIEDLGRKAAAGCRIKNCQLKVSCEDNTEVNDYPGDSAYDPGDSVTVRTITAKVTCARAGSRPACERTIHHTGNTIQTFLDDVVSHPDTVEKARRAHMAPAERKAADIMRDAETAAAAITEPARITALGAIVMATDGLETVEAGVLTSLRDRYDIVRITQEQ